MNIKKQQRYLEYYEREIDIIRDNVFNDNVTHFMATRNTIQLQ